MASSEPRASWRRETGMRPLLSVATATRNRAVLLERAITSVRTAAGRTPGQVEHSVSDGSDGEESGATVRRLLEDWPGGYQYVRHHPPLDIVENLNSAVARSTGEWVLVLDDDDFLLPGAADVISEAIGRVRPDEAVLLFGTDIVDLDGVVQRRQTFRREQFLDPGAALGKVLRNSSFVRHPAAVVRRSALEQAGPYDASVRWSCDTDMWVRLFSRYGVRCIPRSTCAFTIHANSATAGQWNEAKIGALVEIFDRAAALGVVDERSVRRWQADWFHQFILAGAYRQLRAHRRGHAREIMGLFDVPSVRALGVSPRWLPVRAAFTAATAGASVPHEVRA